MAPPPLITLEEHFFSTSVGSNPRTNQAYVEQFKHVPGLESKLKNLSDIRLRDMDAGKVSFQVVSHGPTPGAPSPQQCIEANDELAAAVATGTGRRPRREDLHRDGGVGGPVAGTVDARRAAQPDQVADLVPAPQKRAGTPQVRYRVHVAPVAPHSPRCTHDCRNRSDM